MTETDVIAISRDAIMTMLFIAGPIMALALAVGLFISIVQSITQIQEMTLTFVPKIVVVFLASLFLAPYMLSHLTNFTQRIADIIIGLGASG